MTVLTLIYILVPNSILENILQLWKNQHVSSYVYLNTAVEVARNLVKFLIKNPNIPAKTLNVNVPDIPFESLEGYSITRLGKRSIPDLFRPDKDLFGENVYWLGPPPPPKDASEGTDFFAIKQNCVSITPLISDFTEHSVGKDLQEWMDEQLI